MLLAAGTIGIDIHQLASKAVAFAAVLTSLRTLLLLLAQLANRRLMHFVGVSKCASA